MKAWFLIVVAVAGCKSGSKAQPGAASSDCELIKQRPTTAVAELSRKYPNNAVKVASTIEDCVAPPSGDECDRVVAIVKAIPAMAPALATAVSGKADYAATCRESPPEMRHCYLPSYALAHNAECKALREKMISSIDLPLKGAPTTTRCDGGSIDVYLTDDGAWVVTGKDPASRCFGARTGKDLDTRWLESELSQYKTKDCKPSVDVAADASIRYQDVIAAMDVAVKVGLLNTTISSPEELGLTFKASEQSKAPQHCPPTTIASPPMSAAGPGSAASGRTVPGIGSGNALAQALVIIVTKDTISIGNGSGSPADVVSVKEAAGGGGAIDPLRRALPAPTSGDAMLILQADQDTSAIVINRIIQTTKAAGYNNVLFAVKNK